MTDTRPNKGPTARRRRAVEREETAHERSLLALGIRIWPADWPLPRKFEDGGKFVRRRRRKQA